MKPALIFTGEVFEQDPEHKRIKNLLIGKWTIVVFEQDPEYKRIKNLLTGEWTIVVFEQGPNTRQLTTFGVFKKFFLGRSGSYGRALWGVLNPIAMKSFCCCFVFLSLS